MDMSLNVGCVAEMNTGDYMQDGLIRCGFCGGRKERYITMFNVTRKVRCLCDCEMVERKKREEEFQKQQFEERLHRLKSTSLMDVGCATASFDKMKVTNDNKQNIEFCRKYSEEFSENSKGLLMYGDVGTGKSYCAASIANSVMEKGIPCIMTSLVRAMEIIRRGSENEEEFMATVRSVPLLIFDDMGSERSTDFAMEKIFNIVDTRYRSGKPMIITTNIPLVDMVREEDIRYKRVYDRIFEVCSPMKFTGPSWRKLMAKEAMERG